jgi:pimeloyl-ACP methyl ester carboxylesterase
MPFLGPAYIACIPGLLSNDAQASSAALQTFVRLCAHGGPTPEDFYFFLGYNTAVPPHVREGLVSRTLTYDDLLSRIRRPVLITHGIEDKVVLHTMSEHHARLIPHATISSYADIGHSAFWKAPERFNRELRAFATSLA